MKRTGNLSLEQTENWKHIEAYSLGSQNIIPEKIQWYRHSNSHIIKKNNLHDEKVVGGENCTFL